MKQEHINEYCKLDSKTVGLVEKIYDKYEISTRSYFRMLKVSRTIADLNGKDNIEFSDIIEALQYKKIFL